MIILPQPPLMWITDPEAGRPVAETAEAACAAGLRWICLRDPDADEITLIETGKTLRDITRRYGAKLYVSRNLKVARKIEADGLHASSQQNITALRREADQDMIIGQSAHSLDTALQAAQHGADYVTLSPVYASISKPEDTRAALGIDMLAAASAQIPCPVIALGGMHAKNISAAKAAGASGAAMIGAISHADDIAAAVMKIIENWRAPA